MSFAQNLRLNVNGDKLWTRRVRLTLSWVGVLILAQFAVEWWAFGKAFQFAFGSIAMAIALALPFALIAAVVDWTYLTADFSNMNGRQKLMATAGRLILLLGIPLITSIPVQLGWFESEITNRISREETLAINEMRTKALDKLKLEYHGDPASDDADLKLGKIGVAEREAEAAYNEDVATAEKDLNQHKGESEAKRLEMKADAELKERCSACEASGTCDSVPGCVASGRYGRGPAFQAKKEQADNARTAYETFVAETDSKTTVLQAERDKKTEEARTKKQQKIDDVRAEYTRKQVEIRNMKPEEMRGKLEGDWKRSYGFLARYQELQEMEDDPEMGDDVSLICLIAEILMMLFGIGVLIAKHNLPSDVHTYFSLSSQARAGNPESVATVRSMSDGQLNEMGFDREYFDLEQRLRTTHRELVEALTSFERIMFDFIRPRENGLFPTRREIQVVLQERWVGQVQPAIVALEQVEQDIRQRGMTELELWPEWIPLTDRRGELDPWNITGERLASYGWVDPMPRMEAADMAIEQWAGLVDELRQVYHVLFPAELRFAIQSTPTMLLTRLHEDLYPWFSANVQPRIRRMDELLALIQRGARRLPAWPNDLPILDDLRTLWRVSEAQARVEGWKGPNLLPELPDPSVHSNNGHHPLTGDELTAAIEARAHQLWLDAGQPDGQADLHWNMAQAQIAREQAAAATATN